MHPGQALPANQDEFPSWKSSLRDFSRESGCIPELEIIPVRLFPQIRINFPAGNHPSQTFLSSQDAFPRRKSSLPDFSCKSGSIPPLRIIPLRHFYLSRMHSDDKNHPCKTFPANQDQFPHRKSSLPDIFIKSGCIPPLKIIPAKKKPANQDYFPTKMHPRPSANHLAAAFQQLPASHQPASLLTPGFFLPRLDPEQCPEASWPSEQCPLCLHSKVFLRP